MDIGDSLNWSLSALQKVIAMIVVEFFLKYMQLCNTHTVL